MLWWGAARAGDAGNQTTIAGAVEEQSATTSEITKNVNDIAVAARRIVEEIGTISDGQGGGAAAQLAGMSHDLEEVTSKFQTGDAITAPIPPSQRPTPSAHHRFRPNLDATQSHEDALVG